MSQSCSFRNLSSRPQSAPIPARPPRTTDTAARTFADTIATITAATGGEYDEQGFPIRVTPPAPPNGGETDTGGARGARRNQSPCRQRAGARRPAHTSERYGRAASGSARPLTGRAESACHCGSVQAGHRSRPHYASTPDTIGRPSGRVQFPGTASGRLRTTRCHASGRAGDREDPSA